MHSFESHFQNILGGALSHTLFGRGKLHPYPPHHRFAAQKCQITKSLETKCYGHPDNYIHVQIIYSTRQLGKLVYCQLI